MYATVGSATNRHTMSMLKLAVLDENIGGAKRGPTTLRNSRNDCNIIIACIDIAMINHGIM